MDTLLVPTLILVALVSFLLYLWRIKNPSHKNKGIMLAPKVSGALPLIGHLHLLTMAGQTPLARTLAALADKYGPIFRMYLGSYPVYVVNDLETIKECFTTNDKALASRPITKHGVHLGYNFAGFGFAPDGPYWRNIKKLVMLELLSPRRLESLKHVYESEIHGFVKDLYLYVRNKEHEASNSSHGATSTVTDILTAGNPDPENKAPVQVVISEWLEHLTFNIITKLIAGKSYFGNFEDMDDAEARRVGKLIREFMHLTEDFVPSDMIPLLEWFPFEGQVLKSMRSVGRDLDALMGSWVDEHIKKRQRNESSDDDKQDFIDVMLSVMEEDLTCGYTRDTIIKATIANLIIGGADSTSIYMTWILSLLLRNKRALKHVQEEIDLHVGKQRWVDFSDIKHLVYLQAIGKETLRLYPPAPLLVTHMALQDCYVGGYYAQKGTRVFVNAWKLHRDPGVWPEPETFLPERFLTEKGDVDEGHHNFGFIPFGIGRRACPGSALATQVCMLTIARLLQGFELEVPMDKPVDMSEGKGMTLPKASPLEILLTPRLPSQLYHC